MSTVLRTPSDPLVVPRRSRPPGVPTPGVGLSGAVPGPQLTRVLPRAQRRSAADAREFADLASYVGGSGRRTLGRRAAGCAVDARALGALARRLARDLRDGRHP